MNALRGAHIRSGFFFDDDYTRQSDEPGRAILTFARPARHQKVNAEPTATSTAW